MKQILLLFLIFLSFTARSQVLIVNGCSEIGGAYYLAGTTSDSRNRFEANYDAPYLNPQEIAFRNSRWELRSLHPFTTGYVFAYNDNTTTPNPPETGWVGVSGTQCFSGLTISYPTTVESKNCTDCNWSDPQSWIGETVPTASNHVVINGDLILDANATCLNLTIASAKSLNETSNKSITVKGKFEDQGFLKATTLALSGYTIPQTLDGTKLNIQVLNINNIGGVTLTGDLSVLKTGSSSASNVGLSSGNIDLGNFNLTCHGIFRSSTQRVITSGSGSLKYQIPGGSFIKEFPIGNSAINYSPVAISGQANSSSSDPLILSARVGPLDPGHTLPQNTKNVTSEWTLTSVHETVETPFEIRFGWPAENMPGGFNSSSIYIKRWNGTSWENKAGPLAIGNYSGGSGGGYGAIATNVTELSPWGVFDSDAVLPVKLANFTAKPEGITTILSWETTEETNSERFAIEHSIDSKKWSLLGEVNAKGESSELQRYTYTHQKPEAGENYYRLKMVDHDGTFAYSRIKNVKFDIDQGVVVYPNPVSDRLYLSDEEINTVSRISILDASGQKVLEPTNYGKEGMSIKTLPSGIYLLKIERKNGSEVSRKLAITH